MVCCSQWDGGQLQIVYGFLRHSISSASMIKLNFQVNNCLSPYMWTNCAIVGKDVSLSTHYDHPPLLIHLLEYYVPFKSVTSVNCGSKLTISHDHDNHQQ